MNISYFANRFSVFSLRSSKLCWWMVASSFRRPMSSGMRESTLRSMSCNCTWSLSTNRLHQSSFDHNAVEAIAMSTFVFNTRVSLVEGFRSDTRLKARRKLFTITSDVWKRHFFKRYSRANKKRFAICSHSVEFKDKKTTLSIAAALLAHRGGKDRIVYRDENARLQRETSFAELEELTAVKIKEAYPVIKDFTEGEEDAVLDSNFLSLLKKPNALRTSVCVPRSGKKIVEFYGTPDPTVAMSNVPCHGCGALLHCQGPGIPGYVPSQKFISTPENLLKDITCQRCHLLLAFNIAVDIAIGPSDYEAIINEIKQKSALLVVVVDLTDLTNSFCKTITSLTGKKRPLYVIGNKVDLLPKDDKGYLARIRNSLLKLCEDYGLFWNEDIKHVALISAKTGYGIEELITQLMCDWSHKGQVYLLGCTNAGKSTLFNALLSSDFCRSSARDIIKRATASVWPGTTLNLLKFPIVNPKPALLHKRMERLEREKSLRLEEEKLRRNALKLSGHWQHATLMGHLGTTLSTPKEFAIEEKLSKFSGFVVPSYTFSDNDSGDFEQHSGEEGLMEELNTNVQSYDDSSFKYWCHDTPGFINPEQVINLLNPEELTVVLPMKLLKPRTFVLKPSQVIFVSGLGRIDYSQGDVSIYFTVFASDRVPVHVMNKDQAHDFYTANIGTSALGVPLGDSERRLQVPPLISKTFTLEGRGWKESVADVILSSIGWVSVTIGQGRSVILKAYTPDGRGCSLRMPPLLQYAVNLRGKRILGTAAYRTHHPKMC